VVTEERVEIAQKVRVVDTPLASVHQRAGAKVAPWFGCALPDEFADWRQEFRFAHESAALVDKNYRCYISFTGPDRVRYLNAILTNNVKDLAPSHGISSLLLNAQGHILAEIETYAMGEQLFCVSYEMIRGRLIETLEKYIIMDDVTLVDETQRYGTLALEGPAAERLTLELTGVDLKSLDELASQETRIGEIPCVVLRRSPGEFTGAEFLVERQYLEPLWRVLELKARAAGGGPTGYAALNVLRLEQGIPWYSYDFGERQIPNEAGLLESHLSFTKGCYTGQEIVERVRSRGHVNRQRVTLKFDGANVPQSGEVLSAGGNEAGYVTRAGLHPNLGIAIGMGYVRRENSSLASELQWEGGAARVSKFPDELQVDERKARG
jgi:folate-binding protein YgfZ